MSKIKYIFPINKSKISKIKSEAHKKYPYSVDFMCQKGTPVKAAANGIVIDIKDDSSKGGKDIRHETNENFVEIRHLLNEYSYYGHIKKGSTKIKVGDRVKAGQIIAQVGKTGWLANLQVPHLHFMVGKYSYKTVKIDFKSS